MLMRIRGRKMADEGRAPAEIFFLELLENRYTAPTKEAKNDCTVLRTMEKRKYSAGGLGMR
jgi:hypothetical protein